jgi:dsDNA-specific endonuclease/ATPase MutS2
LTIDLHPIFRNERDIDRTVRAAVFRAAGEKLDTLEIIPGKGAGKLRDRVLAVLRQPHLKKLYRSVDVDPANAGRIVVYFS